MDARLDFLRTPPSGDAFPQRHTFEHVAKDASGTALAYYWPPKRGVDVAPEQLTLFIPGNPGLPDYYRHFLTLLHDRLPPGHAVLCTSHLGGEPSVAAPATPLSVVQHVDCKVELVEALLASLRAWHTDSGSEGQPPRLALGAHSVGAWMACETAKRVPDVHAVYITMPTVGWIAKSWNGWTLWPLFHRPVINLVEYLAYAAPLILPLAPDHKTTRALISSPSTVQHVLRLARSEMRTIHEPDLEWFREQADKPSGAGVYGVWSGGNLDGWVGKEGPLVRKALGWERTVSLEGVPHAYVMAEENSELVAAVVARWILLGCEPQLPNGHRKGPANGAAAE